MKHLHADDYPCMFQCLSLSIPVYIIQLQRIQVVATKVWLGYSNESKSHRWDDNGETNMYLVVFASVACEFDVRIHANNVSFKVKMPIFAFLE